MKPALIALFITAAFHVPNTSLPSSTPAGPLNDAAAGAAFHCQQCQTAEDSQGYYHWFWIDDCEYGQHPLCMDCHSSNHAGGGCHWDEWNLACTSSHTQCDPSELIAETERLVVAERVGAIADLARRDARITIDLQRRRLEVMGCDGAVAAHVELAPSLLSRLLQLHDRW